jgi:hypothetical protein
MSNGEAAHEGAGDDGPQGSRGRRRFNRPRRPTKSQSEKGPGEKVNNFEN